MKPYVWSPDHTPQQAQDGAYWERNMLALYLANYMNRMNHAYLHVNGIPDEHINIKCGWYRHQGDGFEGYSRVISILDGTITFHVPDDFDLGNLPEIEPNWDGHDTITKWQKMMKVCGCE